MLRRTSKRVKESVDKMLLPSVVHLSRNFWDDSHNGTNRTKLEFVLRQLAAMTVRCLITSLELPRCEMTGQDAERLAGALVQCPALTHLDLRGNSGFVSGGAERLAGVLGQYRELVHLNLNDNDIGSDGAERVAGVLGQCTALAQDGRVWGREYCRLAHLDLGANDIGPAGVEFLVGVLAQ
jgi:hypothetical protein